MWKPVFACLATLSAVSLAAANPAAELSETEARWLHAVWPVVAYAKEQKLALDVVVQPQDAPGMPPLAMAFVNGRCKLVFSMRGNAEAQATLDRIEPGLLAPVLQLMAAHELGHCRRHLDGAWHALPAGHAVHVPDALGPELRADYLGMQATRREEAYGDLVGLAWTWQRHPQLYAEVHAWLVAERSRELLPGSHHDTLVWLQLARQGGALPSLFDGPAALWLAGLAAADEASRAGTRRSALEGRAAGG